MKYILENDKCKVEIESLGAEIKSFIKKGSGQEYMWSGDPAYWGGVSPILFPFIGKLKDFKYSYQGVEYEILKHGFARLMDFTVKEADQNRICLEINDTEETKKQYPFSFRLEVEYRLEELTLREIWRVYNLDEDTMYFSIGGHPAFVCPLDTEKEKGMDRTSCFIKLYGGSQDSFQNACVGQDGLLNGEEVPMSLEKGILPVTKHLFDQDALLLKQQGINAVALCDSNGREYVRTEADVPVWGIWSVADARAGYICLEPWFGICDSTDYKGTLQERPFMCTVESGNMWEQEYRIVVM